jgi:prenyl protein peptidase
MTTTFGATTLISFGLLLVSQAFPKLQIPIEFSFAATPPSSSSSSPPPPSTTHTSTTPETVPDNDTNTVVPSPSTAGLVFKVRCPFDFTDTKPSTQVDANGMIVEDNVRGMDRITRHSGLWSLGCIGLGNAFLQPTWGLSLFMMGPALVALLGGYHYDSRLQRNMGGSFPSKTYEQQTSNVPLVAMILGRQKEHNFFSSLSTLMTQELKLLNAAVAVMIGTLYVMMNKGRHASYMAHFLSSSSLSVPPKVVRTVDRMK